MASELLKSSDYVEKRIYSDGKQVVRVDTENIKEFPTFVDNITNYDICILSDYNRNNSKCKI